MIVGLTNVYTATQVNCLAWHYSEANILASGSFDGTVCVFDASKVRLVLL